MNEEKNIPDNRISFLKPFQELFSRLKAWLIPPSPWIALLGVDGSGKSTILAELAHSIDSSGYADLFVLHRRPELVYRTAVASQEGAIQHYSKAPHGRWISAIKLGAMWLDWLLGYFVLIRRRRARRILVVSDRHSLLDMLVDPERYRYGGPLQRVRCALRFLPKPSGIILLDAPTAVLQTRKQEISAETASALRQRYLALVRNEEGGFVVDASQPKEWVAMTVWQQVLKIENQSS